MTIGNGPSQTAAETVDLTNCDREPIHQLGRVQSFGFLVATSSDWLISRVSENIQGFLGVAADACIGEALSSVIADDCVHAIRNRLQLLARHEGVERVRNLALRDDGALYDAFVHMSGDNIVIEFEPGQLGTRADDDIDMVKSWMSRLAGVRKMEKFHADAVWMMRALTGFDRIMAYKFLHDGSGEVIAELKKQDMEPFLHLRYPASDIPKQARELYLKNPIRIIADSSDPGQRIHPERNAAGAPLDLSRSTLRSVSPIHLEYLANMGVAASMSVSVIVEGQLWGLLACHHSEPLILDQAQRSAVELFGQMYSLILEHNLAAEAAANDDKVRSLTNAFTSAVSVSDAPTKGLMPFLDQFSTLMDADGVGLVLEGQLLLSGATPTAEEFDRIVKFLNGASSNSIFATEEIGAVMEGGADFASRAAGMLAIPISRSPRDYIVFFRREVVHSVTWAGNPEKPVTVGPNGVRLTPRKSFESWRAIVEGQSEAWTRANLRAASQLRLALLEIVLRLSDEAARERKAAQEKQELLIAELNHRVRNILGLVKGIVSQSRSNKLSSEEYFTLIDSRLQALARAHDQITRGNWSASSFRTLVDVEAESYLLTKADRVIISGEDYDLAPEAFSTVALVVHELMTNSMKYGALTDHRGRVEIAVSSSPAGDMIVRWTETGGPPVKAPAHKGFGSTIIERSIPFELNGRARIDFKLSGVEVTIEIPAIYVSKAKPGATVGARDDVATVDQSIRAPESVLIVEDTMIIGMVAEDYFRELGSENVAVASNLEQADEILRNMAIEFALLDVNLGRETSFGLARRLARDGIKIAFASGYGDGANFPSELQDIPRITKPYNKDSITELLVRAGFDGQS